MIRKKRQNDIIKDKLSLIPYLSLKKWHFDLFRQDCCFSLLNFLAFGNFSCITLKIKEHNLC